ncbi:hypothetical protein JTF08_13560 [Micrococcaceae bacterium RIT802]|nr:hypothetical protein [Micrococcaceae bacterium RIT 802]
MSRRPYRRVAHVWMKPARGIPVPRWLRVEYKNQPELKTQLMNKCKQTWPNQPVLLDMTLLGTDAGAPVFVNGNTEPSARLGLAPIVEGKAS